MGATAFVIAQFLNVSYAEVALAAIIPAALYYLGLFMQVDAYAARHGLEGHRRARSCRASGPPSRRAGTTSSSSSLLVVMLLHFKRESHAPFYATALLLVLNQLFSKDTALDAQDHRRISSRSTAAPSSSWSASWPAAAC